MCCTYAFEGHSEVVLGIFCASHYAYIMLLFCFAPSRLQGMIQGLLVGLSFYQSQVAPSNLGMRACSASLPSNNTIFWALQACLLCGCTCQLEQFPSRDPDGPFIRHWKPNHSPSYLGQEIKWVLLVVWVFSFILTKVSCIICSYDGFNFCTLPRVTTVKYNNL